MKVVIEKRKLKSGITSLYLRYTVNRKKERELLELYLYPKKPQDNKETLELAERIRYQRDNEIKYGNFNLIPAHKKKINFFEYIQKFIDNYDKADYRIYWSVKGRLEMFLNSKEIPCSAVSENMMREFKKYLDIHLNGETPFNYFAAMKRILKAAKKDGLFRENPCDNIQNRNHRRDELSKEILLDDELQALATTLCGNHEVKRAALFTSQTGIRKCDIKLLKWTNIFIDLGYVKFRQVKTDRILTIPLNNNAIKLLGVPGKQNDFVFNLPSDASVNKDITVWVKRAGINKHITYHCFRHSCGTNLLIHGVDLKTTSMTLGHTSTKQTEKYTHISDAMKQRAVNKLPEIVF